MLPRVAHGRPRGVHGPCQRLSHPHQLVGGLQQRMHRLAPQTQPAGPGMSRSLSAAAVADADADAPAAPRPRGRPRKTVEADPAAAEPTDAAPRPRGRPRKTAVADPEPAGSADAAPKPLGRSRMIVDADAADTTDREPSASSTGARSSSSSSRPAADDEDDRGSRRSSSSSTAGAGGERRSLFGDEARSTSSREDRWSSRGDASDRRSREDSTDRRSRDADSDRRSSRRADAGDDDDRDDRAAPAGRRSLFGGSAGSRDAPAAASDDQLRAHVWQVLQGLTPSRATVPKSATRDLASSIRAAAEQGNVRPFDRKGAKKAPPAARNDPEDMMAQREAKQTKREKKEKEKPPAPTPPAMDEPHVVEALAKLEAGDWTASKVLTMAPSGYKRNTSRRDAMDPARVEELITTYRAMPHVIKIGRRGITEKLMIAITNQWRSLQVAKLRIHDERSSRNANMPRFNLVLRELEVMTKGTIIEASGKAIWLYRGDDYVQPPVKMPKKVDESTGFAFNWEKRGTWQEVGGEKCYVTGDLSAPTALMVLPDMFPLQGSEVCQACDRIAELGHLVVMPNLLEPREGTWPLKHYPPISVWKNRLMDWYRKGWGSYEKMQEPVHNVLVALTSYGSPPGGARSSVGTFGFGWGGFIALRAANAETMAPAPVKAGVAMYPELFGVDEKIAADIQVPVAILPAKHGPMERTMLCLEATKPALHKRCLFKRAGKVKRGYATWAPEWQPKMSAVGWQFISYGVKFFEHACEGQVFVVEDDKGYKNQLSEDEEGEGEEGGSSDGEQKDQYGEGHEYTGTDKGDDGEAEEGAEEERQAVAADSKAAATAAAAAAAADPDKAA